ncbi:MAG: Na+/H+ antiporter [Rothia sp. (in: high G+C Gram-positive bacteria)]|uniref:Na+/H+ antiporter n=1 Tax=Rothia sp. (in: high G+C Gram-positive bacteria) TaxID=1885016 RepID=UPI0026DFC14F|nr:Na+/H+ antiporter [Rothia sp. (in: high G+C Gram-positive bacteria)]MDO5750472.1 Na+/H+ antiporter [Rothia sp. (in: high G+C Gram-positive bacteria)]
MLEVLIAVSVAILVGNILAHKIRVTPAIVLIFVGLFMGLIPAHQLHEVQELGLPPHVILEIFLPIMLFWEARGTSWREMRKRLRGILLTGTLLVIVTAVAIAWALVTFTPIGWGPALIIGAALAPTDATAVATLNGKLPKSAISTLKGEALINDGTTLVVFALALEVAGGHELSAGRATGMFFYSFAAGILVGYLVGWVCNKIRARIDNPMYFTAFMVTVPFIAFLLSESLEIAEGFKGSGVVAVVVAAIYLTYYGPETIAPVNRFYGLPIWAFISFALNGALFILVGVQLPEIWRTMEESAAEHGYHFYKGIFAILLVWVVSIAVRYLFLEISIRIIRFLDRSEKQKQLRTTFKGRLISTAAGLRGGISLAVALSVPYGTPLREYIIFVVAAVVMLSMVVQGLALPAVIKWANLPVDDSEEREIDMATRTALREAFNSLDEIADEIKVSDEVREALRSEFTHYNKRIHLDDDSESAGTYSSMERRPDGSREPSILEQDQALRIAILNRQREVLIDMRAAGTIDMNVLHVIQERLDMEEVRVMGPVELE